MSAHPLVLMAVAVHPHVHEAVRQALLARSQECPAGRLPRARRLLRVILAVLLPRWPGVSVITPTWRRRELLTARCIPSVRAQQYEGPVEHVIISDGPDPALADVPGVRFLPRHVPERNRGLSARRHGTRVASHDVIAYLDDDNAWRPQHLAALTRALLDSGADFAYGRAASHETFGYTFPFGIAPPVHGQVDTSAIVHRRELLGKEDWEPSGDPADWDLVRRWLAAGATWAFVPEVTLDYYARGLA